MSSQSWVEAPGLDFSLRVPGPLGEIRSKKISGYCWLRIVTLANQSLNHSVRNHLRHLNKLMDGKRFLKTSYEDFERIQNSQLQAFQPRSDIPGDTGGRAGEEAWSPLSWVSPSLWRLWSVSWGPPRQVGTGRSNSQDYGPPGPRLLEPPLSQNVKFIHL